MTNKIEIFNSEKETKGLEGTLIGSVKLMDGNNPLEKIFCFCLGKITSMQRLKYVAKSEAINLNADYGVIVKKYETIGNLSGHLQNIEDCDKFLTLDINFYKQKK